MQIATKTNRLSLKTLLLFVVILIVAFLPISSFIFFLKNDAFINYFPPKLFMSQSIRSGFLPLWNPYINFGFPQYGDMNSGYWSPVTWLIASTVGYNAYSFTIEMLLYILLGGLGMFKLTGLWKLHNTVRIIAGISFMCCGYNIGHLQHFNWVSGAAFLPWCLWSYFILLNNFSVKNVIQTALLFYLLIASAHPGVIISATYFFIAVFIYSFIANKNQPFGSKIKTQAKTQVALFIVTLLLSIGLISGYADIVPNFIRGEKIILADSLGNPTNLKSWISCLLPFATVKNDAFFDTDPSMRNCYFGLTFLIFFLVACVKQKDRLQRFLMLVGLVFALLSLGGSFKIFAHKFIPLIGYVRLNGEFRIFTLLCFIITAAIELNKFIHQKNKFTGAIVWIYYIMEILTIVFIFFGVYQAISSKESILYSSGVFTNGNRVQKLKALIDAITFYDTLWIEGSIQLLFLWGIKWCIKFNDWTLLLKLTVVNLIITTLLNIPYTGAGKASVSQVQAILNKAPQSITIPVLQPIIHNDSLSTEEMAIVGHWSMYNKQIGVTREVAYPIILKNMRQYFEATEGNHALSYLDKPFLFTTSVDKDSILIHSFSPNKINVSVIAQAPTQLVVQQNFYPHWYYQNNEAKKPMDKYGINFMSLPVKKGMNNITIAFEPTRIKIAMLLSLIAFLCCCILLFVLSVKRLSLS